MHFDCDTTNLTSSESMKKKKWCLGGLCNDNSDQVPSTPKKENEPRQKIFIASSGTFSRTIARFKRTREMRLLRTLVIILVILVLCTVPLGILFILSFAETDKRYVTAAKILLTTSLINSMANPWIYFWRFIEMRVAFRRMFPVCCRSRA